MGKTLLEIVAPAALGFVSGLHLMNMKQSNGMSQAISVLNWIQKKDYKLLVRSNSGDFAGIVINEKTYYDEENEIKRKRIEYVDLDGNKKTEPRDGISKKQGLVDIVSDIEKYGGLMLTQLTEQGELYPVMTGKRARSLQEELAETKAELDAMKDIDEQNRRNKEKLNELQKKVSNLQTERQELEEDREHFRNVNEDLSKENDRLRIRMVGLQEQMNEYKRVISSLTNMGEAREGEIKRALERAKERKKEIDNITAPEEEYEGIEPTNQEEKKKKVESEGG